MHSLLFSVILVIIQIKALILILYDFPTDLQAPSNSAESYALRTP